MRKFVIAGLALAIAYPLAVPAANNPACSAVQNMVSAYSGVHAVRVVEHFENGAVATVDAMPSLIVKIATQPAEGAASTGTYTFNGIGKKTIDGVATTGYKIARVQTQGHTVDVAFGDHDVSPTVAKH